MFDERIRPDDPFSPNNECSTALIVVTHLLGTGHLVRAAAIGAALKRWGWRVVIASGGRAAPHIHTGDCELVQLPFVEAAMGQFDDLRGEGGRPYKGELAERRARRLQDLVEETQPDAVITELYPLGRRGLAQEFEALLDAALACASKPAFFASVRDVLNPPTMADKACQSVLRLFRRYHRLLVHGAPNFIPFEAAWPASSAPTRWITYTGYVREEPRLPGEPDAVPDADVVVSSGGSAVGLPLYRAALSAAVGFPDLRFQVFVAGIIAAETFEELREAAPPNCSVTRNRSDFAFWLARARVSISMAGYNTACDLAATGPAAILVPYDSHGEREQTLRAQCLVSRGLVRSVPFADVTPGALASAIREALSAGRPDWSSLSLDGGERSAQAIVEGVATLRSWRAVLVRVEEALRRANDSGRRVRFWLRDDDATDETPRLRAFLERSRAREMPIALAVIPKRATEALASAVADHLSVRVLVHGWDHVDHRTIQRKCEYGQGRSATEVHQEFAEGQERLRALFGTMLSLCFVPPWNRIDAAWIPLLRETGYRALSTYASDNSVASEDGLARVDTHLDLLAWAGGPHLADVDALTTRLAGLINCASAKASEESTIGLLTHHDVHDSWTERFLDELLDVISRADASSFVCVDDVIDERLRPAP